MNKIEMDEIVLDEVAFVGETLGPFFLEDPKAGKATSAFEAITTLNIEEAAQEWPFVAQQQAHEALSLMQNGLRNGIEADELVWEYRRLFVGPATKAAPAWGSVYTDREGVVFGQSTLELRRFMRTYGIERLQDEKNPEDHIGLMLQLMAWIAREKPECLEEYLRLHLLTWASHFLEKLEEVSEEDFYRGLARLTKESFEGIKQELEIEVTYPRFYR